MNNPRIDRRLLLKGIGGITVGLPLLEDMLGSAAFTAEPPDGEAKARGASIDQMVRRR